MVTLVNRSWSIQCGVITAASLFWSIAAILIIGLQTATAPGSFVTTTATLLILIAASFGFNHSCTLRYGASDAFLVGAGWLGLTIATEILLATSSVLPQLSLLGAHGNKGSHTVVMLGWLVAPALFTRRSPGLEPADRSTDDDDYH